ncbi:MAG: aspartate aminotransferase [Planctomycetes bacterium]|nr:aspartate aminotransferase [Planctomycetota bacterium]
MIVLAMRPNQRVSSIPLSQTLALDARAKAMIAEGRDIINLSVGEPDFDSPAVVREAAKSLIDSGGVRYTPAGGTPSLRTAIAEHLTRSRGTAFSPAQITVCHSAKHALSGALLTLTEPGDEVLLLLPAWVSYFEMVRFAAGTPVAVAPRADLGPDFDTLRRAITPRTRGIMLNSPCNPSGYVFTPGEITALCDLARESDLWILSDEIYSRLVYDGAPYASPVEVSDDARERTVLVDGASKAFAMTGYRMGYLAASEEGASAVARLHSQLAGSPNAVGQHAFEAALADEPPEVAAMAHEFALRRTRLVADLCALGLQTPTPGGAFYVFSDVRPWTDERGSDGFCEDLLEAEGVAAVPGSAFGVEGRVRFSYAASAEALRAAVERLGRFLARRGRAQHFQDSAPT